MGWPRGRSLTKKHRRALSRAQRARRSKQQAARKAAEAIASDTAPQLGPLENFKGKVLDGATRWAGGKQ